ncbi:MAG TPA: sulfite exporter TauE/SafE family protein, partial [Candidatus Melainabacteria bacterium]|nr:sulfite exporter TauE/SafE family protein [Candidatus Melainabacteria bacterium]
MTGETVLCSRRIRWQVPAALLLFVLLWTCCYFTWMPEPIDSFKNGAVFIVGGFLGAIIGNITAIGGGLIFIPILVFGYHLPAVAALKTSIATQAFGMTSGAIAWSREGKVPWSIVPWAIPGLLAG